MSFAFMLLPRAAERRLPLVAKVTPGGLAARTRTRTARRRFDSAWVAEAARGRPDFAQGPQQGLAGWPSERVAFVEPGPWGRTLPRGYERGLAPCRVGPAAAARALGPWRGAS